MILKNKLNFFDDDNLRVLLSLYKGIFYMILKILTLKKNQNIDLMKLIRASYIVHRHLSLD